MMEKAKERARGGAELWRVKSRTLQQLLKCSTLGKLMIRIASNGHFFTQIPQPLEGRE